MNTQIPIDRMSHRQGAAPANRRGAVSVEMALTAPIIFLFLFATLEFAGVNIQRHTADNAAYEAARLGIVPGATVQDVQDEATRIMSFVGARNINVNVAPATITDETEELTVRVEVPIAQNGWLSPIFFRDSDRIVRTCRMMREEL